MVMAELTRQDPVVLKVGDVGRGHDDSQLNLDLTNRGNVRGQRFEWRRVRLRRLWPPQPP